MRRKEFYFLEGTERYIVEIIKKVYPYIENPEAGILENIYVDTPEYESLINLCAERKVKIFCRRFEMEYSKSELENADFLHLQLSTYCSDFAKEYGTKYSYDNKCKCCGSGKKQISELYIDKTKMGNKSISKTYDLDVVVSQKLHDLFLQEGITGIDFGNVKHKNDKMKNEPILYQMLSTNVLPRLSEKSVFYKEKFCECCQRSGLFLQSLPYYKDESLKEAKDINYTYEYFGGGWAGTPYLIISQKVYRLLKDNKIKGVVFDIVNIV